MLSEWPLAGLLSELSLARELWHLDPSSLGDTEVSCPCPCQRVEGLQLLPWAEAPATATTSCPRLSLGWSHSVGMGLGGEYL